MFLNSVVALQGNSSGANGLKIPDWSKAQSISSGFVSPCDGWIYSRFNSNGFSLDFSSLLVRHEADTSASGVDDFSVGNFEGIPVQKGLRISFAGEGLVVFVPNSSASVGKLDFSGSVCPTETLSGAFMAGSNGVLSMPQSFGVNVHINQNVMLSQFIISAVSTHYLSKGSRSLSNGFFVIVRKGDVLRFSPFSDYLDVVRSFRFVPFK